MRLLKRVEYEAVYGAAQRRSSPQFSVFFRAHAALPKDDAGREAPREGFSESDAAAEALTVRIARRTSRFGISVKKALGGAVVRNRIKRRIREILRRNRTEIPTGWDIVIHPKSSVAQAAFAPLEAELVRLLRSVPKSSLNANRGSAQSSDQSNTQNASRNPAHNTGRRTGPKA
jgi:ribonuclease P protein component